MICIYTKLFLYVHYIEHKYVYFKNRYAPTYVFMHTHGLLLNQKRSWQEWYLT